MNIGIRIFSRLRLFAGSFVGVVLAVWPMLPITSAQASTLTVTSLADSGAGSLRQTVGSAGAGDTISMQSLSGTITLATPIDVNKQVTILGAGANVLAVAGAGSSRLFNVSSIVTITDVMLRNGVADAVVALVGGAIYNTGNLTLARVALRANTAYDGGGAIYNLSTGPGSGNLTLHACELSGNSVTSPLGIGGGAIVSTSSTGSSATLTIVNSTLANNNVGSTGGTTVGGAIYASRGSVNIIASTIDGNHAGATGANLHQGTVAGSALTMRNSIVGDSLLDLTASSADQDIFLPTGATVTSFGYNIVQHRPAASFGANDAADGTAPGLNALVNNGGPTFTMKPAISSPALAFVPLAACVDENGSPLLTDQRNSLRRATGATACDAGAYEYSYLTTQAYSQKSHAGTPYRLLLDSVAPTGGTVTVEPRIIDTGHTIVFKFGAAVSSVGAVRAVDAFGVAIGVVGAPVIAANEVSVNLTGIADGMRVKVSLLGINGNSNTSVSVGFLVGDVVGNRSIGSLQTAAVKGRAGQSVDITNFLYDLNLSGRIGAADIAGVKARSGRTLP